MFSGMFARKGKSRQRFAGMAARQRAGVGLSMPIGTCGVVSGRVARPESSKDVEPSPQQPTPVEDSRRATQTDPRPNGTNFR